MKVKCIKQGIIGLTVNRIYDVLKTHHLNKSLYYEVLDDNCEYDSYCASFFEIISEGDKIKPSYYKSDIDVIEFCQINNLNFMQGNIIKYVFRYKNKNGIEDLLKAKEFIERLLEYEKQN